MVILIPEKPQENKKMSSGKIPNSNIFNSLDSLKASLDSVSERLERLERTSLASGHSRAGGDQDGISLLPGIIHKITAAHDLDGVIGELLKTMSATMVRSLVLKLENGRYAVYRSKGYELFPDDESASSTEGDELLHTAVNSRQIIIVKGRLADQVSFASPEGPQVRYGMFIPMVFGAQVPLVYFGESLKPPAPELAETIIGICTLVIKNQHLTAMLSEDLADLSEPEEIELGEPFGDEDREDYTSEELEEEPEVLEISLEEEEGSELGEPEADSREETPETARRVYRSVADFDSDIISAEDLIRSFNIDINGSLPETPEETEDFLESLREMKAEEDEKAEAGEVDLPGDAMELEIEFPAEDLGEEEDISAENPLPETEPEAEEEQEELEEEIPIEIESPEEETESVPLEEGELTEEQEEALSFARLLVTEIKLYNENEVLEGRKNSDLYHRLKEQIDLSREVYENRIPDQVRARKDYFNEELVKILAQDDPALMGIK